MPTPLQPHAQSAPSEPDNVLSLAECLRRALENNLDLVSAKKDPAIAAERVEETKAPFDGVVGASGSYADEDGENTVTDNALLVEEYAIPDLLGLAIVTGRYERFLQ